MASSSKLMDEIYDQFLLCKICFETYKRPKTLSCLHTFCEVCLEKHQDAEIERSYRYMLYSRAVSCPICRKKTEMPSGGIKRLPDNFLVANLNDVISRRKPLIDAPLCEICQNPAESDFTKTATSKCLECSKLLCRSCNDLHRRTKVTQTHTLFDIEVEKDIECKIHKNEVVRFYCELCEMCICVVCTFQEHKGHEVSSFTEGMQKYRNSLDNLVGQCRERIVDIKGHIDLISKCETEVKKAEDQIRDTTIDTIAAIRKKEKELMEKLYAEYGTEAFEYFKEKTPLQETLETLQSTCTLTDIITKDQNIELLLLKKDIQEKLTLLLQRELLTPPDGMARQVRFTPGHLVFGSIVTDLRCPDVEACDGVDGDDVHMMEEGKSQATGIDLHTQGIVTADQWTSMGQFVHNYNNEQLTQTDKFSCISRGCSPMLISASRAASQWNGTDVTDVGQQCSVTAATLVMKRKIQTEVVSQGDQEKSSKCSTDIATSNKFTNTLVVDTRDRSTATKRQKVCSRVTDTAGLVSLCHKETVTPGLETVHHGTLTDAVDTAHKSTVTVAIERSDKGTFARQLVQSSRSTMTPAVKTSNVGVSCHVLGQNKAVGTKTVVMTHTSAGSFDVRTRDQSIGTTWCGPVRSGPEERKDKETFTNNFNKVDKITATHRIFTDSVGTSTPSVRKRHTGVGTPKIGTTDQSVEADFGHPKPESSSVYAQTTLTFNRDVIMPSRYPREIGVCTEHVEYRTRGTATPKIKHKHKHVATDSIATRDSSSATNDNETGMNRIQAGADSIVVNTRDNGTDTYRGLVQEVSTNTDFEDVNPMQPTPMTGESRDPHVSAVPVQQVSSETQTVQSNAKAHTADGETTMGSTVLTSDVSCCAAPPTADSSCNTFPQKTRYIGPLAAPVRLKDTGTVTDTASSVHAGTTTVPALTSDVGTAMTVAQYVSSGTDPVIFPGDDSAGTAARNVSDAAVGTPPVSSVEKETATDPIGSKNETTVSSTKTPEQATSLPKAATASIGTNTDALPEARRVETMDTETMTALAEMVSAATTMSRDVRVMDSGVCTDRVELVTTAVDAERIVVHNVGTGTQKVAVQETATTTDPRLTTTIGTTTMHGVTSLDQATTTDPRLTTTIGTTTMHGVTSLDQATTTNPRLTTNIGTTTMHGVTSLDQATSTAPVDTADAEAVADILKPYIGRSTFTMTTPIQTANVGILKRPHTVSRGTEPTKVRLVSTGTAAPVAEVRETSSMTQATETNDKAVSAMTIKAVSKSTGTPDKKLVSSSTSMTQVQYTDRESSPISVTVVGRASSPILMDTCDRESSPIRFAGCHKAVGVRADTKDTYTSTAHIRFRTRGTMYESTTTFVNREVSPVPELQPSPPKTAEKATTMPKISYTDREASPVRGFTKHKGTATMVVEMVDRGSAPVPIATKTKGSSAVAKMVTKGVCTPHVTQKESSTQMVAARTVETATGTPHVTFTEKETSMPVVHTMHKNVSTENISTAEKQTSTCNTDVTAAYRETIAVAPLTVTRGTCTPVIMTNTRETSPPHFSPMKDRASSPFRIARMVDKSTSVTRGEILEPQDKFQKVGAPKVALKPIAENSRPTLACIHEDSSELTSSDDDCGSSQGAGNQHQAAIGHSPVTYPPVGCSPVSNPPVSTASITPQKAFMHRETFQTSQSGFNTTPQSTFSSVNSGSASSILWKVEMATNTTEVSLETKGTSTPPVNTEDKAICTESITMEGKMAACINKLKNVRQRLEQQPLYSQASSQSQSGLPPKQPAPSDSALKPIAMQARSKSVSDSLDEGTLALSPMASQFLLRCPASSTDSLTMSESSDQDLPPLQARHGRRLGLARKQRLDISQLLLRSSSVPENTYERPKLQVRTVQAHVIPKLSVETSEVTDEQNTASQAGAGGAKPKRAKHRAKPRDTQNIQEVVLDMRRNSDGGDTIRARQDRQKDRFEKLTPMRRLAGVSETELATTTGRSSPRVRRKAKAKETVGPGTQESGRKEWTC